MLFEHQIGLNQAAFAAPVQREGLYREKSGLVVRRRGSFIMYCALVDPETDNLDRVFYSEPDAHRPKLAASHVMMPVGPNDGLGGQHGFPRWADYESTSGIEVRTKRPEPDEETSFEHEAVVPQGVIAVRRGFNLEDSALTVTTTIMSEDPVSTSLGHHDYYTLEDGKYNGLAVNGQHLDDLLEEKGAAEAVMNGSARFWPGFGGQADVRFPSGRHMRITATARHEKLDRTGETGMLLWRRPDAPYICLEPVLGVEPARDSLATRELYLDEMGTATLQVRTELLTR